MIDVAVVGSLHLDIMVKAPRLPGRDETLIGSAWYTKCGGKGGNQAVAAARFGARTSFGGQTGDDDFGRRLRANLQAAGVDTRHVDLDGGHGSGMSVAIEEAGGEYGAVVVSGANLTLDATAIAARWVPLWAARVLLLQNEVPEPVSLAAAQAARQRGARIILNAAPARTMSPALLDLVDILIVNRVEARMLSGCDDMEEALVRLAAADRDVILTRGGAGLSIACRDGRRIDMAAHPVKLLASHGAGDCFGGAFAARFASGDDTAAAADFARVAAGLFVARTEAERALLDASQVRAAMGAAR